MSLLQKLEGDSLSRQCEREIRELHRLFVTWFRGESPVQDLEADLCSRLLPTFSHVAPNGHMVKGRDVLLQYLTDKYGCYQDRVFSIDVYNVQLLWNAGNKCLASYEEWQSWDVEDDEEEEVVLDEDGNPTTGKQQFGRLSTCLLEKEKKTGKYRWIHVHETWLEAEEPVINPELTGEEPSKYNVDEETVMTGPVPPSEMAKRVQRDTQLEPKHSVAANKGAVLGTAAAASIPAQDDTSSEEDEDEEQTVPMQTAARVAPVAAAAAAARGAVSAPPEEEIDLDALTSGDPNVMKYLTVLISKQSLSHEQVENQQKALSILKAHNVMEHVNTIDGTNPANRQRRNDFFAISKMRGIYPQFFITNQDETAFWGTWEDFEAAERNGTLLSNLGLAGDGKAATTRQAPPTPDSNGMDPEQQFLNASKGILTFEDEDDSESHEVANATPSAAAMKASDNREDGAANGEPSLLATLMSPPDASKKRHVSPKLESYAKPLAWENQLVGVSIKGFDIGTGQGTVGDSGWIAEMNKELEDMSQSFSIPVPKRKICLPEMIYPTAHVVVEGHGMWLSWDATDALHAWAKCHQMIAVKSRIAWEGVNVIKAQDAELWEMRSERRRNVVDDADATSIFHYDWTYSTPFCVKAEGGEWVELDESGMRMELLKDQSIPILFFDDIVLYEDDLHDNGIVQYSVKLRVMPTCTYVLARLFVRVDNVILRVRETRVLIDFFSLKPQIFRDICWRECNWDNLADHGLPINVKQWACDPVSSTPQKIQQWQSLLQQLPEVKLPKNYLQFAVLEPKA